MTSSAFEMIFGISICMTGFALFLLVCLMVVKFIIDLKNGR